MTTKRESPPSAAGPTDAFIPFLPRFRKSILSGTKTMTSRGHSYGKEGDILGTPFGFKIKLTMVRREQLGVIADCFFLQEGCQTPGEFADVWREIHPSGFYPSKWVWLHEFEVVNP